MAIFGATLDIAIAIFLVLVFAEYIKIRAKASKPFNMIAVGGVFAVLAAVSPWIGAVYSEAGTFLALLFGVVAWILVLIGTLGALFALLKAK